VAALREQRVDLEALRQKIDELDAQIVRLLNDRARIVVQVGKLKADAGAPIYAPDRERKILDKVKAANTGPLPDETLVAIWRELMSGSFRLERPLRIAYLGPEGTFSHVAAMQKFGASVEYMPVKDITSVFEEVSRDHADYGLVPIENSTGGSIADTLDCFHQTTAIVCGEVLTPVHQNLLANCPLAAIQRIYSKPQVFNQCRRWLNQNFQQMHLEPVNSTAEGAAIAAKTPGAAAIGSALAGELNGLKVVCANIEDNPRNTTRFLVIGRHAAAPSGEDKTALMFTVAHKAGALCDVLEVFRRTGINLTKLESHPAGNRNWEYFFFADAEGHADQEPMATALKEAAGHCSHLRVLGSFPRAIAEE
jgi:chorismate mutase/prephenate dehydratase